MGLVHGNLAFKRIQTIDIDFGQREDVGAVRHVAVTVSSQSDGEKAQNKARATQESSHTMQVPSPSE